MSPALTPSIAVSTIDRGDAGSLQTLGKMRALVRASIRDAAVVQAARAIVRFIFPRRYAEQIGALRSYLSEHFQFVKDPSGMELLSTPRHMLDTIARAYFVQGDCDDAAILAAALAVSVGFRVRFVAVGFGDATSPLVHVFAEVNLPGSDRWYDMDTTRPADTGMRFSRVVRVEV